MVWCSGVPVLRSLSAISDYVAAVSVGMLGGKPVLDLDYEEDSTAEVDMNIIMTGNGRFVEIQGTAEREPFRKEDMNKLITLAGKGIEELIGAQKKVLPRHIILLGAGSRQCDAKAGKGIIGK